MQIKIFNCQLFIEVDLIPVSEEGRVKKLVKHYKKFGNEFSESTIKVKIIKDLRTLYNKEKSMFECKEILDKYFYKYWEK